MDKLILIPFALSAILIFNGKSLRDVFLMVFLPSLTLFPAYFDIKLISGLPEIYFWSAALIPIIAVGVMRRDRHFKINFMDTVVLLYVLVVFMGQWFNSDYKIAQKLLFQNSMALIAPYMFVRILFRDRVSIVSLLKTMAALGALVAVANAYESRMFMNLFDEILRNLWPHAVEWDVGFVQSRWGLKRAMGPFGHPIIAGCFFSMMIPLAIWLIRNGCFKNPNWGKLIVFLNILGLLAAISRGPILGAILGGFIIYFGFSRSKSTLLVLSSLIFALTMMVILPKLMTYVSVTRATAETPEQQNAAYRKEMMEAYWEVVTERPWAGWGRYNVPSVDGMKSIDNHYLGVALQSGLIALGGYLTFLLGTLVQLVRHPSRKNEISPQTQLAWCLIASLTGLMFSQATVYSGGQINHYLFMLGGLAQNLLDRTTFNQEYRMNPAHPKVPTLRYI